MQRQIKLSFMKGTSSSLQMPWGPGLEVTMLSQILHCTCALADRLHRQSIATEHLLGAKGSPDMG